MTAEVSFRRAEIMTRATAAVAGFLDHSFISVRQEECSRYARCFSISNPHLLFTHAEGFSCRAELNSAPTIKMIAYHLFFSRRCLEVQYCAIQLSLPRLDARLSTCIQLLNELTSMNGSSNRAERALHTLEIV